MTIIHELLDFTFDIQSTYLESLKYATLLVIKKVSQTLKSSLEM